MALAIQDVRLIERDLVAICDERLQQAAIVSRGAVPVRRQQARSVEGDIHSAASRGGVGWVTDVVRHAEMIVSNSSTRCAQVWRWRIVSRPLAANDLAKSRSRSSNSNCAIIASALRAVRKSPLRNSASSSRQGAQTRGMPHANASNTRMVGMPGSVTAYGSSWHVHRHQVACKGVRNVRIGNPAAVLKRGAAKGSKR